MNSRELLGKFKSSPIVQMVVIFLAGALSMAIAGDGTEGESRWRLFGMAMLLYVVLNPVFSIWSNKWGLYTGISVICFILLVTGLIFTGNALAEKSFGEMRNTKFLFMVLIVFYIMLIGLSGVYRTILNALKGTQKKGPD